MTIKEIIKYLSLLALTSSLFITLMILSNLFISDSYQLTIAIAISFIISMTFMIYAMSYFLKDYIEEFNKEIEE